MQPFGVSRSPGNRLERWPIGIDAKSCARLWHGS